MICKKRRDTHLRGSRLFFTDFYVSRKICWLDKVRPAELKQVGYISLGIYLVFSVHCVVLP